MRTIQLTAITSSAKMLVDSDYADGFYDDTTILQWVNEEIEEFYDLLYDNEEHEHVLQSMTIAVTSSVAVYDIDNLPIGGGELLSTNFYRAKKIIWSEGDDRKWTLPPFNLTQGYFSQNYSFPYQVYSLHPEYRYRIQGIESAGSFTNQIRIDPIPRTNASLEIYYLRTAPVVTSFTDSVLSINGYEKYIVYGLAKRMAAKEERSLTEFQREQDRIKERIQLAAKKRQMSHSQQVLPFPWSGNRFYNGNGGGYGGGYF